MWKATDQRKGKESEVGRTPEEKEDKKHPPSQHKGTNTNKKRRKKKNSSKDGCRVAGKKGANPKKAKEEKLGEIGNKYHISLPKMERNTK